VFYGASELRNKVQLPLLGVVSLMLSDGERQREKMDRIRFWFASGSLVGIFVVGLSAMAVIANR
jgi:hypothetical protein